MIADILAALRQIFSPRYRPVLLKILATTLALLALVWVGLYFLIDHYMTTPYGWLSSLLSILAGAGLIVGLVFLAAPVSSLIAGLFLDEIAEKTERDADPNGPVGRPLPVGQALQVASKFALLSLALNLFALILLLVPVVNVIAFFAVNSYLLGREYFELAALRFQPLEQARAMRKRHAVYLWICGAAIAAFLMIPLLNMLTPLFGTAFMVRIHKNLQSKASRPS